ncbi:uncharacterized protein LOC115219259 isoform X1 [Octopus sinensis]|uniref:Uncharacterized protein LOC115219259 isoform X1 n=1 Tax=Octopus sinensis TaxID=2607531 RepID=A0A6P7T636_9MOLL|nr:uncharacterized protein LOC115219259 isoform X1 [Octopus sinensis]
MAKANFFYEIFLLLLLCISVSRTEEEVKRISFDYYQCNRKTYIDVTKTKFEVNTLSQSTVLYRATSCNLTFKTEDGDICMDIKNINIEDCYVKLNVFTDNTSGPKEVFSCNPSPTDFICSQRKLLRIELVRKNLDVYNYDFTLIVMRKDVIQLRKTDVISDGPMKTIIITIVVIIIIIIAIVIAVCYCSKCSKEKRTVNGTVLPVQQINHEQIRPSAPPANEVYGPPYFEDPSMCTMLPKEDPPPYSEHS